jgi:hypothetical protein
MNCFDKRFPKFLGTSGGYTRIDAIDLDYRSNLAFAGQSGDSNLVSTSSSYPAIVGFFPYSGFEYKWLKELSIYNQDIKSFKFRPDGTQVFLLYSSPLTLI